MEDAHIIRMMPANPEAERAVIGSMLLDSDMVPEAMDMLQAKDFYDKACRVLFETITQMHEQRQQIDVLALMEKLKIKETDPEINNLSYIGDIINSVPVAANIRQYARIVADKSFMRAVIKVSEQLTNRCYADRSEVDEIVEDAQKGLFDLLQKNSISEITDIQEIAKQTLAIIEAAYINKGNVNGISTGFNDLDEMLSGLQKSDLIIIAARASMGKTAFALSILERACVAKGYCTALFSLEMSKTQIVQRLVAINGRIRADSLRKGDFDDNDLYKVVESLKDIGNSALFIDDSPGITMAKLRNRCMKLKLENNLSLVIIDYLQLISSSGRVENRQQEVSAISRSLKALAREIECPVIALSQLSRETEKRNKEGKRPMLSDLRESGAIEQDADVVMFIYRDEYYNADSEDKGAAEIIIAKQRNGPTGTVKLSYQAEYTRFANLAR